MPKTSRTTSGQSVCAVGPQTTSAPSRSTATSVAKPGTQCRSCSTATTSIRDREPAPEHRRVRADRDDWSARRETGCAVPAPAPGRSARAGVRRRRASPFAPAERAEPGPFERAIDDRRLARSRQTPAMGNAPERHIVAHAEARIRLIGLPDHRHEAGALHRPHLRQWSAEQVTGRRRGKHAGQQSQQRGLAAPFGPMNASRSPAATSIEARSRMRCRRGFRMPAPRRQDDVALSSREARHIGNARQRLAAQAGGPGALVAPAVLPRRGSDGRNRAERARRSAHRYCEQIARLAPVR